MQGFVPHKPAYYSKEIYAHKAPHKHHDVMMMIMIVLLGRWVIFMMWRQARSPETSWEPLIKHRINHFIKLA